MFCFKSGSSHCLYMQCLAELVKVLVLQSSELRLPGRSVSRRSSAVVINSPSMFFCQSNHTDTGCLSSGTTTTAAWVQSRHPRLARVEPLLSLITVKLFV